MHNHRRLDYLDSIRGIAALLVAYSHFLVSPAWRDLGYNFFDEIIRFSTTEIFDIGKFGVVVFFAISGFVIPISLLKSQQRSPRLAFALKRFFRLYPAYWLSIILAVLVAGVSTDFKEIALNMTMFQRFFGGDDILNVYWTLQIELIFYFLCIILLQFNIFENPNRAELVSYIFLGLALLLAIFRYMLNMKLPVAVMLALSIMFWASIWREHLLYETKDATRRAHRYLYIFLAAMPIIALLAYNIDLGKGEVWYRYVLSYYLGILAFIILTTRLRIKSKIMKYLGEISYSVYLMHLIVLTILNKHSIIPTLSDAGIPNQLSAIFYLMTVIALSSIAYHLIELPGQKLGATILRKTINRQSA